MRIFVIFIIATGLIGMNSCCNSSGDPVAGIRIEYTGLSGNVLLYDIQTNRNDLNIVVDTVEIYLNEVNKHMLMLTFEQGENNHILVTVDSSNIDTLTSISFNKGKCDSYENLKYEHNGEIKTENVIVID